MGRPRTPTTVLENKGSFKKHPERKRDSEPIVRKTIGEPPEDMSEHAQLCWRSIVLRAPKGVLTYSDHIALRIASELVSQFILDPVNFPNARLTRMHCMLKDFGLTPTGRAQLSVPQEEEKNPFEVLSG